MRSLPAVLLIASLAPFAAEAASFDVAPTTLDLTPGAAGLFYVANRGKEAVTVQLQPMDWKQDASGDVRTPSTALRVSPQFATIAPGARQSVRVLAKPDTAGEHSYRLMVSEIPGRDGDTVGVHVLLQFSVPVFAGHDPKAKPALHFSAASDKGKAVLDARNDGSQTVKLTQMKIGGVPQGGANLVYILPGATRRFEGVATRGTVTTRDERSGTDIQADIAVN